MRKSRLARRRAGGKGATNRFAKGQTIKMAAAKTGVKTVLKKGAVYAGSRLIPIVGWAMLIADVLTIGHEAGRRLEGESSRLVGLNDAHEIYGELELEAQTTAQVRDFFESDAGMLRAIGQEGKMNSSMEVLKTAMTTEIHKRVVGADLINRDPYFDSADSLLDRAVQMFQDEDIQGLTDETIRKLRANGYGNTKSGR